VKIILDEQLDPRSAAVLNVIEDRHGCTFVSLRDLAPPRTQDIKIPHICRENDAVGLVTADVKDFGAKAVYFRALLEAGVSVVTLRPQRRASVLEAQTALLLNWSREIAGALRDASTPVLIRVNNSGISIRNLEELVKEISSRRTS
jgi:predicted nuclease of predicted toxin-antitoxin system